MKLKALLSLSLLGVSTALLPGTLSARGLAITMDSSPDGSSDFQVSEKTEIPGSSLKPGNYTIRIADHLTDRMLIEIRPTDGGKKSSFLAVPASDFSSSAQTGPVIFSGAKDKPALRGFAFSNGSVVEFVYPKAEAVTLAKDNGVKVMAVDPSSEGMAPDVAGLSPQDRQLVTLWMLTPAPVGSDKPKGGITAAKYQAPAVVPDTTPAASTTVASTTTDAAPLPAASAPTPAPAPSYSAPVSSPRPSNALRAEAKPPVIARLPKTGSLLPVVDLAALASLLVALCMSVHRLRRFFN